MEHSHKIALAVEQSKNLEVLLKQRFSAYGKGLTEKVKSIEYNLPAELVSKIKHIAKVRNNVVHDDGKLLVEPSDFLRECEIVVAEVSKIPEFRAKPQAKLQVEGYSETFEEFTKRSDGERKHINVLVLVGCFIVSVIVAIKTHPVMMASGFFGSYLIAYALKRSGYKQNWKEQQLNLWSFFHDQFSFKPIYDESASPTTVRYNIVKAVRLSKNNIIEIACVDRGVTTNFTVLVKDQEASKSSEICKEIHDLIFRSFDSSLQKDNPNIVSDLSNNYGHDGEPNALSSLDDKSSQSNDDFNSNEINVTSNEPPVNPATGLPMTGPIDTEGNPYGTDLDSNSRY